MSTLKTCTSKTRPSPTDPALGNRPTAGDMLFETDTKRIIMFDGTEWYVYDYNITTAPIYTVTIEDSVGGNEAISSAGPYAGGAVVTLSHAEDTGYDFESWTATNERTGEIVQVSGNSFVMPYANVTVVANYVPVPTYAVSVNGGDNGTTLSTVTTAEEGDTITISANPNPDFALSTISVTDANLNSVDLVNHGNNTYTFKMPGANATVATFYVPTYAVTLNGGVAGTTTVDVATAVQGQTVKVTTTPDDQFELSSIVVTDANSANVATIDQNNGDHVFVMPGSAVTIVTTYVVKTYAINIESPENGTTTSNLQEASLNNGVIITTTPNDDYRLGSLVIVDENANVIPSTDNGDGTHSLTMPGSAITVTSLYSLITFDVVVKGGLNGVTVTDVQDAARTESVTVTTSPSENYYLDDITVVDLSVVPSQSVFDGTFTAVTFPESSETTITSDTGGSAGNITITGDGESTLSVLSSLAGCTVDISGDETLGNVIVKSGEAISVSGGADATFSTITTTFLLPDDQASNEVTITSDTAGDVTITLTGDDVKTVSALATEQGATATGDGAIQVLKTGETITVSGGTNTETASFTGVFLTRVEATSNSVIVTTSESGLGNVTIVGNDAKTIAALAAEINATVTGSGAIQVLKAGEQIVLEGTGNRVETTNNGDDTHTFIMPEGAVEITTSYSVVIYSVSLLGGDNGETVVSATESSRDQAITVTATPNEGFAFESISVKNSEDQELEVTQNEDGSYGFTMPADNVSVSTSFVQLYTIEVAAEENGTTAPSLSEAVAGTSILVGTTPSGVYNLGSISVQDANGQNVEIVDNLNGTHTFIMPESNVTITSVYVAVFTITLNGGENGTTESSAVEAESSESVTITTTPSEGYQLDSISAINSTIDSIASFDGTFTAVTFGTSETTTITADTAGAGDITLTGDGTSTIGQLATAASATVDISEDTTLTDAVLKLDSSVLLTSGSDATSSSFTGTFTKPDDSTSAEVTITADTAGDVTIILTGDDAKTVSELATAEGATATGDGAAEVLKVGETITISGGSNASASFFTGTFDTRVEADSANVVINANTVGTGNIVITGDDITDIATLATALGATASGDGSPEVLKSGETVTLIGESNVVNTIDNNDGTHTITMPSGNIVVTTTFIQ